jgi:uncharacterized protein with NRDE domain
MTVLRAAAPRILGGRDERAGGTWLAINEHGVMAGLTNRPGGTEDPGRRSRGELPLALARSATAKEAVAAFQERYRPADYRPGWLLVADRDHLFSLDMTCGERPLVALLPAGLHVLENRPPGTSSPKVQHTTALLHEALAWHGSRLLEGLEKILSSHVLPAGVWDSNRDPTRVAARQVACVHTGDYGTRSSLIVVVPASGLPRLWSAGGPPCTTPFTSFSALWAPAG